MIQQEFYSVAFRTKVYQTIEELQKDLDNYLKKYNNERTDQGKHCLGQTPMECFEKDKHLAKAKMIGYDQPYSSTESSFSDSGIKGCNNKKVEVE